MLINSASTFATHLLSTTILILGQQFLLRLPRQCLVEQDADKAWLDLNPAQVWSCQQCAVKVGDESRTLKFAHPLNGTS